MTTLFKIIQSELIKKDFDEFTNNGNLVLFDDDYQFTTKILKYDEDVKIIVNRLFDNLTLKDTLHDDHFKKTFILKFINRKMNKQTIEAFKMELISTFLIHETFLNSLYKDFEKYINNAAISTNQNNQSNTQNTQGNTIANTRSAFADLPQSENNLDLDNTIITNATDNTVSRNKNENTQEVAGQTTSDSVTENRIYNLETLFKSSLVLKDVFNNFDRACFMQIW